ncbi:Aluminum-activated malate transporter 1 [Apostasia shenzhenica]|uniref:Aluminum-activated malate transporter 1 n=1 Tax=Apostasia shenzhenica TaxID=1088818 RepID=A0A2I0AEH3_9ASPA|nr:Aluminum-activated malate transporter 1 [Apostasia shenzhenica]
MEAPAGTSEKVGFSPWSKLRETAIGAGRKLRKIGTDDPRRILHSLKVGLALTLISIFYYVKPLFHGLGASTMWAVLTVVVVMEYTVGGTLSKGLNRAFATLLAGALGLGAHQLAALCGDKGEPILLSVFVFLLAAMATFSRFVPEIKARYDYGVTIFILTFSLVAVSGYRVDQLLQLAHQRLSTIAIGVATCLATSIFVFPVWAGEDLHDLVALNLEKLANYLEGLGKEHFGEKMETKKMVDLTFLQSYKSVLNSKSIEDALANFARWEPGHGGFGYRHPWKHYLKIGALIRQCACSIEALNAYISIAENDQMTVTDEEFLQRIRADCAAMSSESGKALAELAAGIRQMECPLAAVQHMSRAAAAAGGVKTAAPAEDASMPEVLRSATTASLLSEVVRRASHVVAAVEELSQLACFKRPENSHKAGAINPVAGVESPPHVVVYIEK